MRMAIEELEGGRDARQNDETVNSVVQIRKKRLRAEEPR